jgi:glycosyl transferase family 25
MWEFIDKIIYINLDHREDRRNIMKTFFEKAEIPTDKIIRFSAIKRIRGSLGCLESHTAALRMAKQNSWKNVLILEDDLEWLDLKEGYSKLEELTQKPDWDVIMLTGWFWKYDFPRIYNANNAGAYLVNSSYYDKLLQNREFSLRKLTRGIGFDFNNKIYDADNFWKKLQSTDNWYAVYPCICRQVDGYSDHCRQEIKASLVYGIGTLEIKKKVYG